MHSTYSGPDLCRILVFPDEIEITSWTFNCLDPQLAKQFAVNLGARPAGRAAVVEVQNALRTRRFRSSHGIKHVIYIASSFSEAWEWHLLAEFTHQTTALRPMTKRHIDWEGTWYYTSVQNQCLQQERALIIQVRFPIPMKLETYHKSNPAWYFLVVCVFTNTQRSFMIAFLSFPVSSIVQVNVEMYSQLHRQRYIAAHIWSPFVSAEGTSGLTT